MQHQDQSEKIETVEKEEILAEDVLAPTEVERSTAEEQDAEDTSASTQVARGRFDWPALIAALALAAFFALTARFNSQPAPSYIPAAVFSATGCGLLVTAIRKLRAQTGAGLREAALSGFGMALFQFAVAFTYPDVFTTVTTVPDYSRAFLLTWGLITLFAVVLSLAGATIGHLAFAPLRPLPARAQKRNSDLDDEDEDEDEDESFALDTDTAKSAHTQRETSVEADEAADEEIAADEEYVGTTDENDTAEVAQADATDEAEEDEAAELSEDEDEERIEVAAAAVQTRRVLPNYLITVLLLGLLPMMAGYVFAAAYDFTMNAIQVSTISPALYPTLSLLSGLLPLRLAAPINLSGPNGAFIVFTLLWRIPDSVLGNPNLFDVQALESLVFTATGLALLLITRYGQAANATRRQTAPWSIFLLLQALLGLILILPANLWLMRGLEGVLQFQNIFAQLPTIHLLNTALFVLNFVIGVVFSLIIGLIVRRQYQLWSAPRVKTQSQTEELD